MTIKLIVAQRGEVLTKEGPRTTVILMSEDTPAKLELAGLPPVVAANFPLGRKLEITVPTFSRNNSPIIVPG